MQDAIIAIPYIPTQKELKRKSQIQQLKRLSSAIYFFALSVFLFEGFYVLITAGEKTFELIPNITLVSEPTSAIFFPLFGFALYFKWNFYAPLMLGAVYSFWECSYTSIYYITHLTQYFLMPFLWIALIFIALIYVQPKFNFTNLSAVILFFTYGNLIYSYFVYPQYLTIIQILSQLTIFLFTWKSVNPK